MKSNYEIKSTTGEIKGLDRQGRVVEVIMANYNKDSYNDVIVKGAFAKTLQERGDQILFLNQHNWSQPHGFFDEVKETDMGLYGRSKPLPNTTYSNDLLELYDQGIIKEHSIGFQTIKSTYEQETGVRTITEIKLYEGSNVTMGANSQTPLLSMKGITMQEIQDQESKILKAIRSGNLTDETYRALEIAVKQLREQAIQIGLKQQQTIEPEPTTQPGEIAAQIKSFINTF